MEPLISLLWTSGDAPLGFKARVDILSGEETYIRCIPEGHLRCHVSDYQDISSSHIVTFPVEVAEAAF